MFKFTRACRLHLAAAVLATAGALGCNGPAVLTVQAEARRFAAELQVAFAKANEATNRAVLADTDEASAVAAEQSEKDTSTALQLLDRLDPRVQSLGDQNEIRSLAQFKVKFDECRRLDSEILPLAVENTNLKAQRLSFGEAQETADAFSASVDAAASASRSGNAALQAARARAEILAMQVLQARHIAEANDMAMDIMEQEMAVRERSARTALEHLRPSNRAAARELDSAAAALDRFVTVNRQIVALSRRNTNVRSLALTLGRKRVVAAEAEDELRSLDGALAAHTFRATR